MDDRTEIMQRDVLLIATAGVSLLNGMHFSPWFDYARIFLKPILYGFYITSELVTLYLVSLLLGVATLLVAGLPARAYEAFAGLEESNTISIGIWLLAAIILSFPAILASGGAL